MKIYLVGGAVRDKLLHRPVTEKDWVVVGASPAQMQNLGFTPVGKDFPVFLHPQTKEEYALARTERKTGQGYGGFSFYCGSEVSLEDDLIRRDLTINAMAEDEAGNIIDPYGGQADLNARLLRHVSNAFCEDPVRILRVARFAARYSHLGFSVAFETLALMEQMVEAGEVDHLVQERIWKETQRALTEPNPEVYFQILRQCGALARLIPEFDALFGVPQNPLHHPEVDTGVHSLMALQQAVKLSAEPMVRFATLLHDLGKGVTPAAEWPRHIGHEIRGLPLVNSACERLGAPREYRELALLVAEWHTHCHRALELKASTLLKTLNATDAFRRPQRFALFLLSCEADARGRTGFENRAYPQADLMRQALLTCQSVPIQAIQALGFKGKDFGDELNRRRLQQLKNLAQPDV